MATTHRTDVVLLTALYVAAAAALCAVIAFYRIDERLDLLPMAQSSMGLLFSMAVAMALVAGLVAWRRWRASGDLRRAGLTAALVGVTLGVIGVTAEVGIRLVENATPEGLYVHDTVLLPRDWTKVAAHRRALWEQSADRYGVYVFDDHLGWTIGPNRRGSGPHGESYYSSADGVRVGAADLAAAGPVELTIALVGDSYTFASDVNYEDSWGYHLEQQLGAGVHVLNFGVPGYGIDQAYLRYERDVRPRQPDLVVLALISHDLLRSTMVYYQIGFPGAQVPGAKPRFIVRDGALVPVNLPLPPPDAIYAAHRVEDLPHINLDRFYRPSEWRSQWYSLFHFLRLGISWLPQGRWFWNDRLDPETETVNHALLRRFVQRVREDGAVPVLLFLPSYTEYRDAGGHPDNRLLGLGVLDRAQVSYLNALPCLKHPTAPEVKFTFGWHYTPEANRAVGRCLATMLREQALLPDRRVVPRRSGSS